MNLLNLHLSMADRVVHVEAGSYDVNTLKKDIALLWIEEENR